MPLKYKVMFSDSCGYSDPVDEIEYHSEQVARIALRAAYAAMLIYWLQQAVNRGATVDELTDTVVMLLSYTSEYPLAPDFGQEGYFYLQRTGEIDFQKECV